MSTNPPVNVQDAAQRGDGPPILLRQLVVNVLSNYGAFVVNGVVNFVLLGYMVRTLGKDAFGIVALALSLVGVGEVLGTGICVALSKYLAGAIAVNDREGVKRLFSGGVVWLVACSIVGGAMCFVAALYIDRFFEIPEGMVTSAKWAVFLIGVRVLIGFPFNAFQAALFAHQRYDVANLIRAVTLLGRLAIIILWFELVGPGLIELVVLIIVSMIAERLLWMMACFRVNPDIRLSIKGVDRPTLLTLMSFGSIILFIIVGNLIGYELVKWVIGHELSIVDVGAYTLIASIAVLADNLVRSISNVLMPVSSHYSALEMHETNRQIAVHGGRYATAVAGGVCLVPLALLGPLLRLWVGDEYGESYLETVALAGCVLLVGQWVIATSVCMVQMVNGVGRIRVPAAITVAWAVGGVPVVWAYLHWTSATLLAAAIGIAIVRGLGALAHIIYGSHVFSLRLRSVLVEGIAGPASIALVVAALGFGLAAVFDVTRVTRFVPIATALALGYVVLTWLFVVSGSEKKRVVSGLAAFKQRARAAVKGT